MRPKMCVAGLFAVLGFIAGGCGDGGPEMAEASGVVTYNGTPLEGATVVFLPSIGPPATANTDAQGRFSLNTRGEQGAVVGSGKISVTAVEQLIEFTDESKMSSEDLANMSRSLIPEKYGHVATSGLTATVDSSGSTDLAFALEGPKLERSKDAIPPDDTPIQTLPQEA